MIKLKSLILNILLSVGTGLLSSFLTGNFSALYQDANRPALAPPAWLFPVVWSVLYVLMGVSAYIIGEADSDMKSSALRIYYLQLAVNFLWSPLFFVFKLYWFSFFWLLLLWILVLIMIIKFSKINKVASYLQIPYLIWLTFAAYLNLSVAILN
ncbi:MAG: tryptophan-rich sensory protein [Clostridia bacterium]|nr:tryptophan-rich sensory protein [Clostridia bacterium]